jgi:hypothetical protein
MYRFFIVGVLAAGCGAGLEPGPVGSAAQALRAGEGLCPPGQALICHQFEEHCVGAGAVAGHVAHGDFEGRCETIGTPPIEASPDWMAEVPAQPAQVDPAVALAELPTVPDEPVTTAHASAALRASHPPSWTPQAPKQPAQPTDEEGSGADAPSWTPEAPQQPVPLCAAEVGAACGGTFGGCCDGLRCAWGVCLPDDP